MSRKLPSTVCDRCGSTHLSFDKLLGLGYIGYRAECWDCGRKRHVQRTREVYEIVKDQPWVKSKALLKEEKKALSSKNDQKMLF